jgi:hypothetical protein
MKKNKVNRKELHSIPYVELGFLHFLKISSSKLLELNRSQWFVLSLCDGTRNIDQIRDEIEKHNANKVDISKKLNKFLKMLEKYNAIVHRQDKPQKNIFDFEKDLGYS